MAIEQLSVDELEVDTSMSVGPSQAIAQENTPSEVPAHRQVLRGGSSKHPSLPDEHTSSMVSLWGSNENLGISCCNQQRQSEQEAAEQR